MLTHAQFEGYHAFLGAGDAEYGSFEVFHSNQFDVDETVKYDDARYGGEGWYWWPCLPGFLPDGDPTGPFATSREAFENAREV